MGAGLTLQAIGLAWIAAVSTPTTPYLELIGPFLISGVGMALFFAPVANVVLSSVWPHEEGQASGANNAIRELGGVFGVAVLAAVFTASGGYRSGQRFVDDMDPAVMIGAALVAVGAIAAFAIKHVPQPAQTKISFRIGRSQERGWARLREGLYRKRAKRPPRCRLDHRLLAGAEHAPTCSTGVATAGSVRRGLRRSAA
jgi:MFS family permease